MGDQIGAHVTLVYPQEAANDALLTERVRAASYDLGPFRLRLGGIVSFEESGAYIDVEDIDGGYRKMRDRVLRPPFHALAFRPHVTLIHPRTSRRACAFQKNDQYRRPVQEFTAPEVTITAFDGIKWIVLQKFGLKGS